MLEPRFALENGLCLVQQGMQNLVLYDRIKRPSNPGPAGWNERLESTRKELKRVGFLDARDQVMSPSMRSALMTTMGARQYFLWGSFGKKLTSMDVFGHPLRYNYLVLDDSRFKLYLQSELETAFRQKNPNPDKNMRFAFTRFMHDRGLSWTQEGRQTMTREGRRVYNQRYIKTHKKELAERREAYRDNLAFLASLKRLSDNS